MRHLVSLRRQRGISLAGLIIVIAVLGFVGLTLAKMLPAYIEYSAIKTAIQNAKQAGNSTREIQQSFDKTAIVNDINAISAKDLIITRDTGETEISFSYEKRVPLIANISLLIDFSGTTAKNGVVPEKPAAK